MRSRDVRSYGAKSRNLKSPGVSLNSVSLNSMSFSRWRRFIVRGGMLLSLIGVVSGCDFLPLETAQPASGQPTGGRDGGRGGGSDEPIAVQMARAVTGSVTGGLTYTGTTQPNQQIALKAKVSGEVIAVSVDVGDAIAQGDLLAQLDGDSQTTSLNQAQAELSARRAQTAQAEVSIRDAEAAVVQAQATFDQARIDANRLRQLADQGGISQQEAEAAELAATNAQQAVVSAQAQVNAQRQAVASATDQVSAQQAVLAESQRQLANADLRSPLTGVVLSRQVDIGDFVDAGATLLELGDLSTVEVTVQVSELDISQLRVGQPARVQLDAFPGEGSITGQIQQISPVANGISRLVPVQVIISNTGQNIGSGLLARVQFSPGSQANVVIPESALTADDEGDTVFVIEGEGEEAKAIARSVSIGDRTQEQVEILSGIAPGDAFVVESDRPLVSGQAVRLSILSESADDTFLEQPNSERPN